MGNVKTTKIQGGAEYALVPDRLKEFRENNPRALIETAPTIDGETIIFKARIVSDKSDPHSAEATGHSYGLNKGAKAFEKLETVSIGRALSILGYLNNGEIASTEELQEFEAYRLEKFGKDIAEAKTVEQLMAIYNEMNPNEQRDYTDRLTERKREIEGEQDVAATE